MTKAKYPRICHRQAHKHGCCVVCKEKTADRSCVECSFLRGEDNWVFACKSHRTEDVLLAIANPLDAPATKVDR